MTRTALPAALLLPVLLTACSTFDTPKNAIDAAPVLRMANTMEKQGNIAMAAQFYARAAEISPDDPKPLIELARIYQGSGKNADALELYQRAVKLDGTAMPARQELARLLLQKGDAAGARDQYQIILDASEGDVKTLSGMGVALDMQGLHKEAQGYYRKALARDPDNANVANNLARSLTLSGNAAEAVQLLQPLADGPQATPTLRQNLALARFRTGDEAGAEKLLLADQPAKAAAKLMESWRQEGVAARMPASSVPATELPAQHIIAERVPMPDEAAAKPITPDAAVEADVTASVEPPVEKSAKKTKQAGKTKTETKSEPEAEAKIEAVPALEPLPEPVLQDKPETELKAEAEHKAEPKAEPKAESEIAPPPMPEPQPEPVAAEPPVDAVTESVPPAEEKVVEPAPAPAPTPTPEAPAAEVAPEVVPEPVLAPMPAPAPVTEPETPPAAPATSAPEQSSETVIPSPVGTMSVMSAPQEAAVAQKSDAVPLTETVIPNPMAPIASAMRQPMVPADTAKPGEPQPPAQQDLSAPPAALLLDEAPSAAPVPQAKPSTEADTALPLPPVAQNFDADLGTAGSPAVAAARIASAKALTATMRREDVSFTTQDVTANGQAAFRVLASGFGSLDDVQDFCDALEAAKLECALVPK